MRRLSLAVCLALVIAPVAAPADRVDDSRSPFQKKIKLATDELIIPTVEWRVALGFEMFEVFPPVEDIELKHFPEELIKELTSNSHANRKSSVQYLLRLAFIVRGISWEQDCDALDSAFPLALGKYRHSIQTALDHVLKHGSADERILAAIVIHSLAPNHAVAVDVIVKELQAEDTSRCKKACEFVGDAHLSHSKIIGALATNIDRTNAEVRRAAAQASWKIGRRAAPCVPVLVRLLESGDGAYDNVVPFAVLAPPTRMNLALLALSQMAAAARPAVPAIVKLLKKNELMEVCDCLARLRLNARASLSELRQVLHARKGYDRLMVAATILCIDPEDDMALGILLSALRSPDLAMRNQALNACARFGPKVKALVPALIDALKDDCSPPDAGTALLTPLKAQYSSFDCALCAIAQMGPLAKPAIPALTELAISGSRKPHGGYNSGISSNAALALECIGKASIPALKKVIDAPASEGADRAIYALGRMGKDGADAIPILMRALAHENASFRLNAAIALGRLKCRTAKEALLRAKVRQEDTMHGSFARMMAAWAISQLPQG